MNIHDCIMLSNYLQTPGDEVMIIQNLRLKDSSVFVAGQVFTTAMIMQCKNICLFSNVKIFQNISLCHNQSKSNVKVWSQRKLNGDSKGLWIGVKIFHSNQESQDQDWLVPVRIINCDYVASSPTQVCFSVMDFRLLFQREHQHTNFP